MVINDMVWKNVPILIFLVLIRAGCDQEPDLEVNNIDDQVLGQEFAKLLYEEYDHAA